MSALYRIKCGFAFSGSARFCAFLSFPSTQPRGGVLLRGDEGQGYLLGHSTRLWRFGVLEIEFKVFTCSGLILDFPS